MRKAILYVLLLILLLLVVFIWQNTQVVELKFLWMAFSSTLSILVLLFLVAGLLIGWIGSRLLEVRMRRRKQAASAPPAQAE